MNNILQITTISIAIFLLGVDGLSSLETTALLALYNSTTGPTAWTVKWNISTDPCATPVW